MLYEWRWDSIINESGDIIELQFDGEKYGQDIVLFNAIAPFVRSGSYIEMSGEDGASWRWAFDGKICKEIDPTFTWE